MAYPSTDNSTVQSPSSLSGYVTSEKGGNDGLEETDTAKTRLFPVENRETSGRAEIIGISRQMGRYTDGRPRPADPNVCFVCGLETLTYAALVIHVKALHPDQYNPRVCCICSKRYATLQNHVDLVHRYIRNHRCDQCGKCYFAKCDLIRHQMSVHEKVEYRCTLCSKICSSDGHIRDHYFNVHQSRITFKTPNGPVVDEVKPLSKEEIQGQSGRARRRSSGGQIGRGRPRRLSADVESPTKRADDAGIAPSTDIAAAATTTTQSRVVDSKTRLDSVGVLAMRPAKLPKDIAVVRPRKKRKSMMDQASTTLQASSVEQETSSISLKDLGTDIEMTNRFRRESSSSSRSDKKVWEEIDSPEEAANPVSPPDAITDEEETSKGFKKIITVTPGLVLNGDDILKFGEKVKEKKDRENLQRRLNLYECVLCGQRYGHRNLIEYHLVNKHDVVAPDVESRVTRYFMCTICDVIFPDVALLEDHQDEHHPALDDCVGLNDSLIEGRRRTTSGYRLDPESLSTPKLPTNLLPNQTAQQSTAQLLSAAVVANRVNVVHQPQQRPTSDQSRLSTKSSFDNATSSATDPSSTVSSSTATSMHTLTTAKPASVAHLLASARVCLDHRDAEFRVSNESDFAEVPKSMPNFSFASLSRQHLQQYPHSVRPSLLNRISESIQLPEDGSMHKKDERDSQMISPEITCECGSQFMDFKNLETHGKNCDQYVSEVKAAVIAPI